MPAAIWLKARNCGLLKQGFGDGLDWNLLATTQAHCSTILYNNSPLVAAGAWLSGR
jgi:hypothetical protein